MKSASEIAGALGKAHREGPAWRCMCPAHNDHTPSLSIVEKGGKILFKCWAGCEQGVILAELRRRGLWAGRTETRGRGTSRIIATYPYRNAEGALRYQVVRLAPKKFFQRRPNGSDHSFINNMDGVEPLPYQLPEILALADSIVFVCEGEKDADNVAALGLVATCNHGGAGKWRPEISRWFAGRDVVILPDNDEAGRNHSRDVAQKLRSVASRVRILDLDGLKPKGDVSDWIAAGGTREQLEALASSAPVFHPDSSPDDPRPPAYSDDALALRFSERHGSELRYVATWGEWFLWNDTYWMPDGTLRAFDLARAECREASAELLPEKTKLAAQVASAKSAAAVERLARSDRRHASTTDCWDRDLWLLNTPTSTIDLRSGCSRAHRRDDFITKTAAVGRGDGCLRWLEFLQQITACNLELQRYLQRVAGYVLTGSTQEHALFFLYGTGANGKSTFVNTLLWLLGGYAASAPMETFTASQFDRHPTELAGLRGARLVVSIETEEGRRWAESRIKALTGGEPIRARFMRQDFFEFIPRFKLMVAGNHKPVLRNVDRAMRRRMNLIPFTVEIPKREQDAELPDKLQREGPGILSWAIEGCAEWQRGGLAPPSTVIEATEEYLSGEDSVALWIEECCSQSSMSQTITAELYASWCNWCERTGEQPGSMKRFSQVLEDRGYAKCRVGHESRMGFRGLAVRQEDMSERYWNR